MRRWSNDRPHWFNCRIGIINERFFSSLVSSHYTIFRLCRLCVQQKTKNRIDVCRALPAVFRLVVSTDNPRLHCQSTDRGSPLAWRSVTCEDGLHTLGSATWHPSSLIRPWWRSLPTQLYFVILHDINKVKTLVSFILRRFFRLPTGNRLHISPLCFFHLVCFFHCWLTFHAKPHVSWCLQSHCFVFANLIFKTFLCNNAFHSLHTQVTSFSLLKCFPHSSHIHEVSLMFCCLSGRFYLDGSPPVPLYYLYTRYP